MYTIWNNYNFICYIGVVVDVFDIIYSVNGKEYHLYSAVTYNRLELSDNGVVVSSFDGINDGNFSRKLRKELSETEKEKILNIIKQIVKERT